MSRRKMERRPPPTADIAHSDEPPPVVGIRYIVAVLAVAFAVLCGWLLHVARSGKLSETTASSTTVDGTSSHGRPTIRYEGPGTVGLAWRVDGEWREIARLSAPDRPDERQVVIEAVETVAGHLQYRRRVRCLETLKLLESCVVCSTLSLDEPCHAAPDTLAFSYILSSTLVTVLAEMQARLRAVEDPTSAAALSTSLLSMDPANVLVLGLGGGSVPWYLGARFPRLRVDVVELNADTATKVMKHIGMPDPLPDNIHIHVGDGRAFVGRLAEKLDTDGDEPPVSGRELTMIVVDICSVGDNEGCGKHGVDHEGCCPPAAFKTDAYYRDVKKLLHFPGSTYSGVYAVHVWTHPSDNARLVLQQLRQHFDHVLQVLGDAAGRSSIFFCYDGGVRHGRAEIITVMQRTADLFTDSNRRQLLGRLVHNATDWQ